MKYWETKSGDKIWVRNMTVEHIENTIRMLERNLFYYENDDSRYGEPDEMSFTQMLGVGAIIEHTKDWIATFKRELKRRKAK